ncbi:hypothetical protein BG418_33880 [Streptomyces sp. CBMA152]|nr:hypothetical protein [Streptomyces sp. CBMA152]
MEIPIAAMTAAVCVAALRARLRYLTVDVVGISMEPALRYGDRLLVRRIPLRRLRTGDVVVVALPGPDSPVGPDGRRGGPAGSDWMVKRVAALPGDPVPDELAQILGEHTPASVPARSLVVLGDNRGHSHDSRHCGFIPAHWLVGVAVRNPSRSAW